MRISFCILSMAFWFTTCAITGCSIEKYAKQAIPFVAVLVAVLLLLTYIPGIVLLVPNLLA